jgi:hypothetical protein
MATTAGLETHVTWMSIISLLVSVTFSIIGPTTARAGRGHGLETRARATGENDVRVGPALAREVRLAGPI